MNGSSLGPRLQPGARPRHVPQGLPRRGLPASAARGGRDSRHSGRRWHRLCPGFLRGPARRHLGGRPGSVGVRHEARGAPSSHPPTPALPRRQLHHGSGCSRDGHRRKPPVPPSPARRRRVRARDHAAAATAVCLPARGVVHVQPGSSRAPRLRQRRVKPRVPVRARAPGARRFTPPPQAGAGAEAAGTSSSGRRRTRTRR